MGYNCAQIRPGGGLMADMNWNGSIAPASDGAKIYQNTCTAKHPSIFDPLGILQSDGSTKVFARMNTACTIEVWKVSDGSLQTLTSANCTQLGATGIYYWDTSNLQTQPTVLTDYAYKIKTSGTYEWSSFGKITLKSKRAANFYGDSTWILALSKTGNTCTIVLYDFAGNSIGLSSGAMAEIGTTGIYKWNTSNFSSQPGSETFYTYKMSCTGDTYTGAFGLKTPELGGAAGGGLLRNPPMTGGMV